MLIKSFFSGYSHVLGLAASLVVIALLTAGCPSLALSSEEQVNLAVLFTASHLSALEDENFENMRSVQQGEIESLVVTIDSIELEQITDDGGNTVPIITEPFEIDLFNLVGMAELLNVTDVLAGAYSSVMMSLSNPRLVLVADPEAVITNVQLSNDGHFTMAMDLIFEAGDVPSLVLGLSGMRMNELNDGTFAHMSDFQVTVEDDTASTMLVGIIQDLNQEDNTFSLNSGHMEMDVLYTDSVTFLPDDVEFPTGSEHDLINGALVVVLGTLSADHKLIAEVIIVRSFDSDEHLHGHDFEPIHDSSYREMLDVYSKHYDDSGHHLIDYGDHHENDDGYHGEESEFHHNNDYEYHDDGIEYHHENDVGYHDGEFGEHHEGEDGHHDDEFEEHHENDDEYHENEFGEHHEGEDGHHDDESEEHHENDDGHHENEFEEHHVSNGDYTITDEEMHLEQSSGGMM